jgi:predicted DNA-binding ribbon-helix-helix protein
MKSTVMKRSIVICGHKTSISLEEPFWSGLKEIAKSNKATLSSVVANIDSGRQYGNLSSAIRLYVLEHTRARQSASQLDLGAAGGRSPPALEHRVD